MGFPGLSDFNKATKGATKASGVFTKGLGGMVNGFKKLTGSADQAKNGLNQGRNALGQFTAAGDGLAALGPYGQAIAVGFTVAAIAIAATVGVMLALAAAAISVIETRSKMLAVFSALGGGAAAGKATVAMVDALAQKLPFATDQIAGWAQSLQAAGLEGEKLKSAVTAVAAATALMGDSGGAAAEKMIKQLAEGGEAASKMMKQIQEGSPKSARLLADMGLRIEDVAKAAGMSVAQFKAAHLSADQMSQAVEKALANKGAGPLAEMALTFPAMIAKFKDGFFGLFEKLGPAVKPFMKAIQSLFAQFSKGSPIFKALQPIVTAVFGTLFKYATMAVAAISKFVKANVNAKSIGGVWTSIKSAIAKVGAVLSPLIGLLKRIFSNAMVMKGIVTIFKIFAVVTLVLVTAFVAVGAVIAAVVGFIAGVIGTVADFFSSFSDGASGALDAVTGFVGSVVGALSGLVSGAAEAASNFIDGLVNGISAGAGAIIAAVSGLASGALGAFKSILHIASPSRVMAKMGGHFSAGVAQGIDGGAGKVGDAAADLGDVAKGGAAKGMSGGGGKGGKGGGVNVGTLNLVLSPGTSREIAEEAFAMLMERLAASQGV